MKPIQKVVSIIFFLILGVSMTYRKALADAAYGECVGNSLADYISTVFQSLGSTDSYQNVKFMSPVFNMTNADFGPLVSGLDSGLAENGFSLNDFNVIGGNAYNMAGGNISDWVNGARATAIGNMPIIITEIGWYPHDTANGPTEARLNNLQTEINKFPALNVRGGLIFNVFGLNPDPNFAGQVMNNNQIQRVCGNDCSSKGVGANSASYFADHPEFYTRLGENNMKYGLEIHGGATIEGVKNIQSKGAVPIVRFGAAGDSGGMENPLSLANFIRELAAATTGEVYVIIGPNEPLTECWATEEDCGCESFSGELPIKVKRKIIGKITSSLVETDVDGVQRTNRPVKGASICVYQGGSKNNGLPYYITGFEVGGETDKNGMFALDSYLRYKPEDIGGADPEEYITNLTSFKNRYNFLAVFCNSETISEIIQVDMNALQKDYPPQRYKDIWGNISPRENNEILAPIELTILCDPEKAGAGFPDTIPNPHDPENVDLLVTEDAGLAGWGFAARHHVNGSIHGNCPQFLPYTDRREISQTACGGGNPDTPTAIGSAEAKVNTTFQLAKADDRYKGLRGVWQSIMDQISQFGIIGGGKFEEIEGKVTAQHKADPWTAIMVDSMTLLTGGYWLGPKPLPLNPEGDGLSESYDCELFREANMSYNPGGIVNAQLTQGILSLLSMPYSEMENQLKYMYHSMRPEQMEKVACCIRENPRPLEPCGKGEDTIALGEVRPYRYMIPPEEWCDPEEAGCKWKLTEEYFPSGIFLRKYLSNTSSMNFQEEEPLNDTEQPAEADDRRDKIAYAQDPLDPDSYDPQNDYPAERGDCHGEGNGCGGREEKKHMPANVDGLNGEHGFMGLADTEVHMVNADGDPLQSPIGTMEPYTGFEDKNVASTGARGHIQLLTQHTCLDPIIDGDIMWPTRIEPVDKEGPMAVAVHDGDPARGIEGGQSVDSGGYGAFFDIQIECKDTGGGDTPECFPVIGNARSALSFYDNSYLTPWRVLINWFTNTLISKFWTDSPEECMAQHIHELCGQGDPNVPCEIVEVSDGIFELRHVTYSFDCAPNIHLGLNHQVTDTNMINLQTANKNAMLSLENFLLPTVMRATTDGMGVGIVQDVQSDQDTTQNNEDGFGRYYNSNENAPTDMVDKVRQMVRSYTDSFPELDDDEVLDDPIVL